MATQPTPSAWLLLANSPFKRLMHVHAPKNEVLGAIGTALLVGRVA
jgi:hypothetical protein